MSPAPARTLRFEQVQVGDELPPLEIHITATAIVAGAIASRDYQEVHHDSAAARRRGSADIFMNILTTNGYVGRFVTDWAGPEARLKGVDIRLGAPNYPGDRMRMSGRVATRLEAGGEGLVDVEVVGENRLGHHVSGRVRLALPRSG